MLFYFSYLHKNRWTSKRPKQSAPAGMGFMRSELHCFPFTFSIWGCSKDFSCLLCLSLQPMEDSIASFTNWTIPIVKCCQWNILITNPKLVLKTKQDASLFLSGWQIEGPSTWCQKWYEVGNICLIYNMETYQEAFESDLTRTCWQEQEIPSKK